MKTIFTILFLGVYSMMIAQLGGESQAPQIQTANGIIEGTYDSGISSFKGIPFAQAPVGDLRWKPPHPVKNWEGVRATKKFGPRAMQQYLFDDMIFHSDGMSEDCLYLNVWTPAKTGEEKLPVLVYFYGGGLFTGDGSENRYNGANLARNGMLTLTVNYRLNVFGFLAHPELTKESPHQASGNYGFLDQMAALQWIQENISAFGGDPKKVTIAGESAGSVSVSAQMASPLSKDLIAGAIGSSGSIMGTLSAVPLEAGEKVGLEFAAKADVNSLAELRTKSAEEILEVSKQFSWVAFAPTIDGYFFPKSAYEIFAAGEQAQVPLLLGWNSQERGYQAILGEAEPTVENYKKVLKQRYPDTHEALFQHYPATNEEEVKQAAMDLSGDGFTGFSTWKWADLHSQSGQQAVYRYFYSHPRPAKEESAPKGAVHSAEIEYAMGNLPTNKVYDWTPEDYQISSIFASFYANFVKTGDPNGLGLPPWTPITKGKDAPVMHIDVETRQELEKHRMRYLFLDQYYTK